MGCWRAAQRLLGAVLLLGALYPASATKLQWNVTGPYVNFPFASLSPTYMLRTVEGNDPDRVVIVTNSNGSEWTLSSFTADSGESVWNATVAAADGSNSPLYALTSGAPHSQQQNNTLSLLFVQLGAYVLAVNASDGRTLWQHATYNQSNPKITAYGDGATPGVVYLTSSFMDSTRVVPTPINYIQALDAATGSVKWSNVTALPPTSGLTASDTATSWGVTPLPGLAVYAQGTRLYGLAAEDGKKLWDVVVTAGVGTGLTANITSVTYVEAAPPQRPYPVLLLGSTTWEQTRYIALQLNGSIADPPRPLWTMTGPQNFEGSLADGLARLGLHLPQVSIYDGLFVAWSNRTSYDLANGGKPLYNTYMIARSLSTGELVWSVNVTALGFAKLPVSPPTVNLGVLSFVTAGELVVMDAGSGQMRFALDQAPYDPQSAGGQNSYVPTTTFANGWGQLAVVRCMGSEAPGTLCAYNGYDKPAADNAAGRQRSPAGSTLAAVLMATVAGWLLL